VVGTGVDPVTSRFQVGLSTSSGKRVQMGSRPKFNVNPSGIGRSLSLLTPAPLTLFLFVGAR
jgi:hypothetical protein